MADLSVALPPTPRPSLRPLLKWSGGKRSEIPLLKPSYPKHIVRVIEPFAGGAAVAFDLNAPATVLNDVSEGLVGFYQTLQDPARRVAFCSCLKLLDQARKSISHDVRDLSLSQLNDVFAQPDAWVKAQSLKWFAGLPAPLRRVAEADVVRQAHDKALNRIPKLEAKHQIVFDEKLLRQHLETGIQSGLYTALRRVYNHLVPSLGLGWHEAAWWFVRALCYSGMFRYAKNGHYNVPYGGIGYNSRDLQSSIAQIEDGKTIDFFSRTTVHREDFEALFSRYEYFKEGDFIFVDPPYDSAFSQYNAASDFSHEDQQRLAKVLLRTKAPWMLVIKNTPFILSLYQTPGLHRGVFGKTYQANFRNRHARGVEHLVVSNYPLSYAQAGQEGLMPEEGS